MQNSPKKIENGRGLPGRKIQKLRETKIAVAEKTMPNNTEKSKMRSKSTRKPFRDISNKKTAQKLLSIKSVNNCKKTLEGNGEKMGDDSLDRLLVVHSDISFILHQIDELVARALKLPSKKGKKEVESFADVLSEMHTSLKACVPRFQNVLSSESAVPEFKSEQSLERNEVSFMKEDMGAVIESPEQTKWDSLISPSPLVSWRTDFNTEGGRQLFLLTPLPRRPKAFSSKCQGSCRSAVERITSETIANLSFSFKLGNKVNDSPEDRAVQQTSAEVLDSQMTKAVCNLETQCVSPVKSSRTDSFMLVMTPLRISPLKTCVLLEPLSEIPKRDSRKVHTSTPFPLGVQNSTASLDLESSISPTENLALKYPELIGLKLAHNFENRRKGIEESPNWLTSPPKTCVIMEPPDDNLLENLDSKCLPPNISSIHGEHAHLSSTMKNHHQDGLSAAKETSQQDVNSRLEIVESTPLFKEPYSSIRGKKHPGENTLKKELWTKFEAASTHGTRFNFDAFPKTAHKGFLDILDEADYDYGL